MTSIEPNQDSPKTPYTPEQEAALDRLARILADVLKRQYDELSKDDA